MAFYAIFCGKGNSPANVDLWNDFGDRKDLQGYTRRAGVAFGKVILHVEDDLYVPNYAIRANAVEGEIRRFDQALLKTWQEISQIRQQVAEWLGEDEAQIFDAHLVVLEDPALIDETIEEVETNRRNVEHAFLTISQKYIAAFRKIDDEFIKERMNDIKDVSRRILHNLTGEAPGSLGTIQKKQIVAAHDLSPSKAATVPHRFLQGFVTEVGSQTSHVVIMAKAASVPAVVGVHGILKTLQNGDEVILDGFKGVLIVHPSKETLFRYGEERKVREVREREFLKLAREPAMTQDGHRIEVMANIEGNNEIPRVRETGAEGIGLYRTEYLFLKGGRFPTEEEQFKAYKEVVEALHPAPVILRTYDLGGDKVLQRKDLLDPEANPFLGCRAIRFSLLYPEIFKDQLRAMLRASAYGNLKIMFPMVSGIEELEIANRLLQEVKSELAESRVVFDPEVKVGIMIEVPSAAQVCDLLADHCDFFSIGTNDLMQYLLAVDRGNENVAHLYEPGHPALLRVLRQIIEQSAARSHPLSICGEMAGDPAFLALLIGLGLRSVSVSPNTVPIIKYLIRQLSLEEAKALASDALRMMDPARIQQMLHDFSDARLAEGAGGARGKRKEGAFGANKELGMRN